MGKGSWAAFIITGVLLSGTGLADETQLSETHANPLSDIALASNSWLTEPAFGSRWQPHHPISTIDHPDSWTRPIADLEFQENTALERISRLRSLSLLTLAEFGPSRLFLGVNDEGLVGLHFNVLPRFDHDRYLEVIRMPYLNEDVRDGEDDGLRPDSQ
jgi:hypothetical protein